MKNFLLFFISIASAATAAAQQTPAVTNLLNRGYQIVEKAQHHRVWLKTSTVTNTDGTTTLHTNKVTQLSTGLHRWSSNHWVEANPIIVSTSNGFLAQGAGHSALLATNANSYAATQLRLPDGTNTLKMHVLGLAWHDLSSGSNVMFSVVQDCIGQAIGNRVIYAAAFSDGVNAQLRYNYTKAGLSQEVAFQSRLPDSLLPQAFGMNPQSSHLLIITEIVSGPSPQIQDQYWAAGWETLHDQTLTFPSMRTIPGRAFRRSNKGRGIPSPKTLEMIDGRTLLVERLQYPRINPELQALPPASAAGTTNAASTGGTNASLHKITRWLAQGSIPQPPPKFAASPLPSDGKGINGEAILSSSPLPSDGRGIKGEGILSSSPHPSDGRGIKGEGLPSSPGTRHSPLAARGEGDEFVADWDMVENYGTYYFWCGYTYLISGQTYVEGDFEQGTCLKYEPGASLEINGWLDFGDYGQCSGTPAVLTSVNDNDYGEQIGTDPINDGDYGPALVVPCDKLAAAQQNLMVRYANPGIIPNSPCVSVSVAATDQIAIKSSTSPKTATITATRDYGDWSQPLSVTMSRSGASTAVGGTDYSTFSCCSYITIPANSASGTLTIHPISPGSSGYEKTLILNVDASSTYSVGDPQLHHRFHL